MGDLDLPNRIVMALHIESVFTESDQPRIGQHSHMVREWATQHRDEFIAAAKSGR
jgi:hypothetical protein